MTFLDYIFYSAYLVCIFGYLYFRKRDLRRAWQFGNAFIIVGSLYFGAMVAEFGLEKEGGERTLLLVTAVISSLLLGLAWTSVWRKRKPEEA